jgi:GT2 family glycosyltransferase
VRVIVRVLAAQLYGDLGGSSIDEPSACHLDIVRRALTNTDPPQATPSTITAVIVCYDEEPEQIRSAVDTLLAQTRPPAEVMIVDNGPGAALAGALRGYAPEVTAIESGGDLGFGRAVNIAAAQASTDYLVCLNPDARAQGDCLEQLAAVADSDPRVALVGAQILLDDARTRNAGANPLHPTGISPSGGYGEPREDGGARDVIVVSGACLLLRRAAFVKLGGFVEEFFLYYEDTNLGWRAVLAGMRVVYCPAAIVMHNYEFGGRPQKWFLLERNRIFSVLANYELRTLVLLAPLLLATEAGLLAVAASGGWLFEKLRAYASLFGLRTSLMARRRSVQASRRISDAEVLEYVNDRLGSALMPRAWAGLANLFCVPYMWVVRRLLR